jgi:hypothetical protein
LVTGDRDLRALAAKVSLDIVTPDALTQMLGAP